MTKQRLITIQEIKTTNDVNGNPRRIAYIMLLDTQHATFIEMGYRTLTQTVGDNFNFSQYQAIQLESLTVPVSEYNRIKKSDAYYDNI